MSGHTHYTRFMSEFGKFAYGDNINETRKCVKTYFISTPIHNSDECVYVLDNGIHEKLDREYNLNIDFLHLQYDIYCVVEESDFKDLNTAILYERVLKILLTKSKIEDVSEFYEHLCLSYSEGANKIQSDLKYLQSLYDESELLFKGIYEISKDFKMKESAAKFHAKILEVMMSNNVGKKIRRKANDIE